ncbi:MAG TPA: Uma2 family endonuclease [Vicinamibacteria bacterium]|nr:Uma2 family endonuclease [Vicinamibacteria bacterium]
MALVSRRNATVADLARVPEHGKAEIVRGELVSMSPTGALSGRAASQVYLRLREYERRTGRGFAIPDNVGMIVDLPQRRSFSPDAAYHRGPLTPRFLEGAPLLAVEVRSEGDYGPAAEEAMATKRADYFAAGTLVVWDVDVLEGPTVRVFRSTDPARPTVYGRSDRAEAEPALPGWSMLVDELLE